MASEIKVDTVSEKTSGSGVTIDGLLIKDGGISGDVSLIGTTPTFTIGDAGAEDAALVFDGNAKDFYVALDDSADKLVIGEGSTVGTNSILTITDDSVTIGDAAAVDTKLVFDGNAQDYYVGLDDSADSLVIGLGSTLGTTPAMTVNSSQVVTFAQNPVFPDGGVAIADLDIDGGTDIGAAIVDADLFIVDDGAGGTNRKVTASRLKTYAGGKNTPAFLAGLDGDQDISDSTATKLAFADEAYDSDGVYDASTNYRFTPGVAGKYYIFMRCITDTANYVRGFIYKNGSEVAKEYSYYSGTNPDQYAACAVIVDLDADDYVEAFAWHNGGSTKTFPDGVAAHYFGGFKLLT